MGRVGGEGKESKEKMEGQLREEGNEGEWMEEVGRKSEQERARGVEEGREVGWKKDVGGEERRGEGCTGEERTRVLQSQITVVTDSS